MPEGRRAKPKAGQLGRKPNKRIQELLDFHQLGWLGDEELAAKVAAEAAARDRRETKKQPENDRGGAPQCVCRPGFAMPG